VVDADVDGEAGRLHGYGDLLVVSLPSMASARRLLRSLAAVEDSVGERLPRAFARADVSVDVRVRGVSVLRFGPAADEGVLDRRLSERLGVRASLSLGGVLRSLLR
jgi:hypothetical protein